eukprot:GHRR01015806.1.p1 GENE.GHRR01015806.1~~GHRR01015806.1.p1  ORF type:complete len:453 (+),score=100.59 GHRR01015806.1:758-2116(+)
MADTAKHMLAFAARLLLPSIIPGQFVVTMKENVTDLPGLLDRYYMLSMAKVFHSSFVPRQQCSTIAALKLVRDSMQAQLDSYGSSRQVHNSSQHSCTSRSTAKVDSNCRTKPICVVAAIRILPPLQHSSGLEEVVRFDGLFKGFTFRVQWPKLQPTLLQTLLALPHIKAVEPDQLFYPELASVNSIGGKWEVPTGVFRMAAALYISNANELALVQPNVTNDDVVVAVLDTGIDAGHPDLVSNVVGGLSFVGEDPLEDLNGHGTHVAGTIAANNNGFGTSGVYPGTKVFALQVFNKLGTGSTSSIVSAINWLATYGRGQKIRVANMSLGGPSSVAVCNAVHFAIKAGITFVAAAGNQGRSMMDSSPANCNGTLAVTSVSDYDGLPGGLGTPADETDLDDTYTDFSNWGSTSTASRTIAGPGKCASNRHELAAHVGVVSSVMASNAHDCAVCLC